MRVGPAITYSESCWPVLVWWGYFSVLKFLLFLLPRPTLFITRTWAMPVLFIPRIAPPKSPHALQCCAYVCAVLRTKNPACAALQAWANPS